MRVDGGVAVARKVFDGDEHLGLRIAARAFDVGFDVSGHLLRIFAVGADVDDRVVGVVVDVGDGSEDPVHAHGAGFAGGGGTELA